MKVSVIMPAFNSMKYISKAIDSVRHQTYQKFELIICDDGSTDGTVELVKSYQKTEPRITLIENKNSKGAAGARNTAIHYSTGEFIAFLDSDDYWRTDKLEKQIQFMLLNNHLFSFTNYQVSHASMSSVFLAKKMVSFTDIIRTCDIGCSTVILRRAIIDECGVFPYSPKEDYAYWIEIMKKDIHAFNSDFIGTVYRKHDDSISSSKLKEVNKQLYVLKNHANLPIWRLMYCAINYAWCGVKKHYASPILNRLNIRLYKKNHARIE